MTFLATWLLGRGLPSWLVKILEPLAFVLLGLLVLWGIYHEIRAGGEREQKAKDAPVIASLQSSIADVRAKTAQAQAADLAHKQTVEAAQASVSKDIESDLQTQLADARAAAGAYSLRQQPQAAPGSSRDAPVPSTPDAASGPDGAGKTADLDAEACAENTVKAQGWVDWWTAQAAIPR